MVCWLAIFLMSHKMGFSQSDRAPFRIGVVLSGGGAKGAAHVGFLQALEDAGIVPDCIVGASVGALVGSYYAAGWSPS
jgi:NTE family protein